MKKSQEEKVEKALLRFKESFPGKETKTREDVVKYCKLLFKSKKFTKEFPKSSFSKVVLENKGEEKVYHIGQIKGCHGIYYNELCGLPQPRVAEISLLFGICEKVTEDFSAIYRDENFTGNLVFLVRNRMGVEASEYLEKCYRKFRVK